MYTISDQFILNVAKDLVVEQGLLSPRQADSLLQQEKGGCEKIQSDGSTRSFWRLSDRGEQICLIAAPAGNSAQELAEAGSAWRIGNHLRRKKVAVPKCYGWQKETGVLLFEDLGDRRLQEMVLWNSGSAEQADIRQTLLQQAVENLAHMQCEAIVGFDDAWCWDTPLYDIDLMIEKESKYFLSAFWVGLLEQKERAGVLDELMDIAALAQTAPVQFFLHRDFQSRNIMVKDDQVYFIDYQGGRRGPLAYDIASLLIDPYSRLPEELQGKLLQHYLNIVSGFVDLDTKTFLYQYEMLAMQRNLQIIGAYSFLFRVREKVFFAQYILPAVQMLHKRLATPTFSAYKSLKLLVDDALQQLLSRQ